MKKIKVLQINTFIDRGSTGRITRELADYLNDHNHDTVIAFGRGNTDKDYKTIKIGNKFEQFFHRVHSHLFDRHGFGSINGTKKFIKKIDEYNPDIIHLHNLHGAYLNIEILFNYLSRKNIPVLWLLHDQWTVSGHSTNFNLNNDGSIPTELSSRKELENYPKSIGLSQFKKNIRDKERLFTSVKKMKIITPSNWLNDIISKSFLNKYPIKTIHNGINTGKFYIDNTNVKKIRKEWGAEEKIILLGVASAWNDRKGLGDFIKLAQKLSIQKYQIVLVGINAKTKERLPENIISIENTNSIDELKDLYNVSDIFLNPTYFDNFPTVNIEALACGTPVITYDTGGSSESIDENIGSVVEQGNLKELINEINKFGKKNGIVSNNCRKKVVNEFTKTKTYQQYLDLYMKIIKENNLL